MGKKGGEGDEGVVSGDADAAAAIGDLEVGGAAAEEEAPHGVGEFVAEDVGARQRGEQEPDDRPDGDSGDAGECGEQGEARGGLCENDDGAPERGG